MTRLLRYTPWALATVGAALIVLGLGQGILRTLHSDWVFVFSEGPVLASVHAFAEGGSLQAVYPPGRWTSEAPLLLTLYAPVYIVISGGISALADTSASFLVPRLVSLLALLGCFALAVGPVVRRGTDGRMFLLLAGVLLVSPAVRNLTAAAQVDVLALFWSVLGITILLGPDEQGSESARRLVIAGACFWLALFTKQNYVAAPAAAGMWLLARSPRRALTFGAALVTGVILGVAALGAATGGAYVDHTVRAVASAIDARNLTATLAASAPLQWIAWVGLALLLTAPRLKWKLPEMYAGAAWVLHVSLMTKTGASVNYLVEPLFATLLLVAYRAPVGPGVFAATPARLRGLVVIALAWLIAATVPQATRAGSDLVTMLRQEHSYSVASSDVRPALVAPAFWRW